ncbi:Protein adenylyltransferase SelO, mitochondrial [Exophiala dermatitidis]
MFLRHWPASRLYRLPSSIARTRLAQMSSQVADGASNGNHSNGQSDGGYTLADIPKSNNFTSHLPPDPQFPTPIDSHRAPRQKLGPRMVRGALYTYVRPEPTENPELLAVSNAALRDIGLAESEASSEELKQVVSGNKFYWDEERGGIYPWAQCYGGFQFGQWAGQLGDGRAISLFETTNPQTKVRYEIQLKGAGKTPYSRFADGKAVLRSSIREFVVSEYLNAIGIPTTRALSLTLCPKSQVVRERLEPGAIVCRFAQSWLRLGTFDLMRSRGDRDLIRQTATYVAEEVFGGWETLPAALPADTPNADPERGVSKDEIQGKEGAEENRFTRLHREIVRRNAKVVGMWQAYGFMNGVLNTDNTSIYGLSMDYGPFAFMDNFDPSYTPNHDDYMLRYSYRAQPSIIWWNLVRLGEALGELIGAGDRVDNDVFVEKGVEEDFAPVLIKRAETIIDQIGEEYKAVFLSEYRRLMSLRLGLKTQKDSDFDKLFSELLDTMEALELDFNHFFRRLSTVKLNDVSTKEGREQTAERFFHREGVTGLNETNESGRERVGKWLDSWRERIVEDWGSGPSADQEREKAMKAVNPNFVPRGWLLDDIIDRVQNKNDRKILEGVMEMSLNPFKDQWEWNEEIEKKYCGDVPRFRRAIQCSCSS